MTRQTKGTIGLGEFIRKVKTEIIEYQETHEGEDGLFEIDGVDLEISLGATRGQGGTVKLAVIELGGDVTTEQTHKVQLHLRVMDEPDVKSKSERKTAKRKVRRRGRVLKRK